ncbi:MAG: LPS export ABC transporter periplasmic protein LptC [Saprospirales bacterium]|nr:MAG: LPS export ABC transporter periplasmic protein LptC [Saprospirales bacterium]
MKNHYTGFTSLILTFSMIMLFGMSSCKNELAEIAEVMDRDLPQEMARDVEIFYTDSNILKVRVEAPVMVREMRGTRTVENFTDGVFAEFYGSGDEVVSWVESDRAIRNDAEKKIYLYDNVVLINISGDTLMTEELIWDERAERIYNNRFFRFSNVNEEIYGYKFSSNQEFTEYSFSRGAGLLDPETMSGGRSDD